MAISIFNPDVVLFSRFHRTFFFVVYMTWQIKVAKMNFPPSHRLSSNQGILLDSDHCSSYINILLSRKILIKTYPPLFGDQFNPPCAWHICNICRVVYYHIFCLLAKLKHRLLFCLTIPFTYQTFYKATEMTSFYAMMYQRGNQEHVHTHSGDQ